MKRILTYILCVSFLAFSVGNVAAVEKKEKKNTKKIEQKKTVQKKTSNKKTVSKKSASKKSSKKVTSKKYDKMIDKNNNGIDDRIEKIAKKKNASKKKK